MNRITFPLRQNTRRETVADLQAALRSLDYEIEDEKEVQDGRYGRSTAAAVRRFQEANRLQASGRVDEHTAGALNQALSQADQFPYVVRGQICSPAGEPILGLLVRAVDMDPSGENPLGQPQYTDQDGQYSITYYDRDFRIFGYERGNADLVVRIYDPDDPGKQLAESDMVASAPRDATIDLEVEYARQEETEPDDREVFIVRGRVRQDNGEPAPNIAVRAFHKELRRDDIPVGIVSTTDKAGFYEIPYHMSQSVSTRRSRANLWVRAYDQDGEEIARSAVIFQARPKETIDLEVKGTTSEYTRLSETIKPLLGDLELADLTPEDAQQLAQETGIEASTINRLALASKSGRATGLAPAAFFGLYGQDRSTTPTGLLAQDRDVLKTTLTQAMDRNLVRETELGGTIDEFVSRLPRAVADAAVEDVTDSPHRAVVELLDEVGLTVEQKKEFLTLQLGHRGTLAEFWEAINVSQRFPDGERVRQLRFAAELHTLTKGNLSLVKVLRARFAQAETTEALAIWDRDDWFAFIEPFIEFGSVSLPDGLAGDNPPARAASYARMLAAEVERRHPTAVIRERINRPLDGEGEEVTEEDFAGASLVKGFLNSSRDFTFGRSLAAVDQAIAAASLPDNASREVRTQLLRIERLYRIAPDTERYEFMLPLLRRPRPIDSAQAIVRLGKAPFLRLYRGDQIQLRNAQQAYERAQRVSALTQQMYGRYSQAFNSVQYRVLGAPVPPNGSGSDGSSVGGDLGDGEVQPATGATGPGGNAPPEGSSAAADGQDEGMSGVLISADIAPPGTASQAGEDASATWYRLFGSSDYCECEHCNSVYSPAAYLMDLLEFLDGFPQSPKSPPGTGNSSLSNAREELFRRRPDIRNLVLNCHNTYTELPYVDLVMEILEAAVEVQAGGPVAASSEGAPAEPADETTTDPPATATQEAADLGTESPLYPGNTTRRTEDLLAHPEYLRAQAYQELCRAKYPFSLPFDLWIEEARRYLGHLGVTRHELLELFRSSSATEAREDHIEAPQEAAVGSNAEPAEEPAEGSSLGSAGESADVEPGDHVSQKRYSDRKDRIAAEYLGLTEGERKIIVDEDESDSVLRLYWGERTADSSWAAELASNPREFRVRAGFATIDEIRELRFMRFINPPVETNLAEFRFDPDLDPEEDDQTDQNPGCDLDQYELVGFDGRRRSAIHRFERLRRKLGWDMRDLDQVLYAMHGDKSQAGPRLEGGFIRKLASLKWLSDRLELPIPAMLPFWTDFDNYDYGLPRVMPHYRSLYESLFLSESRRTGEESASDLFKLNENRTELQTTDQYIADHHPRIQSALAITGEELDLLVRYLWPAFDANDPKTWPRLNLSNLALLYRNTSLSKALRLTIRDYLALRNLTGIDPFDHDSLDDMFDRACLDKPTHARHFIEIAREVPDWNLSIPELSYLLHHESHPKSRVAIKDEKMARLLGQIHEGLQRIVQEYALDPDPTIDSLREVLLLLPDPGGTGAPLLATQDLEKAIALIDLKSNDEERKCAAEKQFAVDQHKACVGDRHPRDEARDFIKNHPVLFPNFEEAKDVLTNLSPKNTSQERLSYLLDSFLDLLQPLEDEAAKTSIQQAIAGAFELDLNIVSELLNTWIRLEDGQPAMKVLMTLREHQGESTAIATDAFPDHTSILRLIEKIAKVTSALALDVEEIDWLFSKGRDLNLLELRNLPMKQPEDSFELLNEQLSHLLSDDELAQALALVDLKSADNDLHSAAEAQFSANSTAETFIVAHPDLFANPEDAEETFLDTTVTSSREERVAYSLKSVAGTVAPYYFNSFRRLVQLVAFRDSFASAELDLFDVFDGLIEARGNATFDLDPFLQDLSDLTGWLVEDLVFLADSSRFNFRSAADFLAIENLVMLQVLFDVLRRLGAPASQAWNWAETRDWRTEEDASLAEPAASEASAGAATETGSTETDPTAATTSASGAALPGGQKTVQMAREIKEVVKSKYEEREWLAVAEPLRDELREIQRDRLVAHLLAYHQLKKPKDLYSIYLIDAEMAPCMRTSRLKQATLSVQLFIQRCQQNLEAFDLDAEGDVQRWKWMKTYRVWEANRKVFLYPENWLEPELRRDKSPFFVELENELMQDEVTAETAERAFLNYLEKLDQVARLEVMGMYNQKETDTHILHVFARTPGIPHQYFYRRRIDCAYWTAWERVDLDIEGDHVIPFVHNRRLYLVWPIFIEKAFEEGGYKESDQGRQPRKVWEIQLAWSEFRNRKWLSKRVSSDVWLATDIFGSSSDEGHGVGVQMVTPEENTPPEPEESALPERGQWLPDRSSFYFRVVTDSGNPPSVWSYQSRPRLKDPDPDIVIGAAFETNGYGEPRRIREPSVQSGIRVEDVISLFNPIPSGQVNYETFTPGPVNNLSLYQTPPLREDSPDSALQSREPWTVFEPLQVQLLSRTPGDYCVLVPHQYLRFVTQDSFFYQDQQRVFFVTPYRGVGRTTERVPIYTYTEDGRLIIEYEYIVSEVETKKYRFEPAYHPYVERAIRKLDQKGIDGLFERSLQSEEREDLFSTHSALYVVNGELIDQPYPVENFDFAQGSAYEVYNWEIFLHAPFLIAERLRQNQRFEEAQKWYHYIFDPTRAPENPPTEDESELVPLRFWITKPLQQMLSQERIQELLTLCENAPSPEAVERLFRQTSQWLKHPFDPHVIARYRLAAYQKAVAMRYIDNLIEWGDRLFAQFTRETINEATQLYILALGILGERPVELPERRHQDRTVADLLDDDSEQELENCLPAISSANLCPSAPDRDDLPPWFLSQFCIPGNDKLTEYWDTVEDRLFKLRHCMNIEGVVQELPLFQPPIDPGLLVRAAAAGLDLSQVVAGLPGANPRPHYRFNVLLQQAMQLANELKSLAAQLLASLEKKDAEDLALLRSRHEMASLALVKQIREQQVEEADEALKGLGKNREITKIRQDYYAGAIAGGLNVYEQQHLAKLRLSKDKQEESMYMQIAAQIASLIPNFQIGISGYASSPVSTLELGGPALSSAIRAYSQYLSLQASLETYKATKNSVMGEHRRRADEWSLQEKMAAKEIEQLDKQILAAEIRKAIAEAELGNHLEQIENAKEVDRFMRDKYTDRELYSWMVSQISAVYFQTYRLAYDIARKAENAFRFELGLEDGTTFIEFNYWDSMKKGLLAGEKLFHDLKRMELAYLEKNKRLYELTKHISLAMLDPVALIMLKETGQCFVNLPEAIFDLDYPGHYDRRIKSVSLTIPCVTGPYVGVNCTLSLLNHSTRTNNSAPKDPSSLREGFGTVQSIATSSGQNDSGLFELNFSDERYLPFEGAGVISEWRIELAGKWRDDSGNIVDLAQFDFDTISDVIFHINYTAKEGGETLKQAVVGTLSEAIQAMALGDDRSGLLGLLSARHQFSSEWHRLVNTPDTETTRVLTLNLDYIHFPYMLRKMNISLNTAWLFLQMKDGVPYDDSAPLAFDLWFDERREDGPDFSEEKLTLAGSPVAGLPYTVLENLNMGPGTWSIEAKDAGRLAEVDDMLIVLQYSVSPSG